MLQKKSLSFHVFIGTLIVTLLITTTLTAFSLFSRSALLRQASANSQMYAELLSGQLDHSLNQLQDYIGNIYYLDENYRRLCRSQKNDERYLLAQDIRMQAENYLPLYSFGILFYIMAPELRSPVVSTLSSSDSALPFSELFRALHEAAVPPEETDAEVISKLTADSSNQGQYIPVSLGEKSYLFLFYERDHVCLGTFVDVDSLISTIRYVSSVENTGIMLTDAAGNQLSSAVSQSNKTNRLLISEAPMQSGELTLKIQTPQNSFLKNLSFFQTFLISITVLVLLVFILYFVFQQWKIYRPLRDLRSTLQRIGDGDLHTRLDAENSTTELSEIYRTINTYIDHVTELRTQTYEERLTRQNIEMQFLQLQLRPHFFLNSLKGIYALAENRKYADIQEYVLCLSNHFRFLLYDTTKKIELKKELMHTQNYMNMQRIGLNRPDISCSFQVSGVNENSPVPPLIIQTFIENSIKYALLPDQPLHMDIHVQKTDLEDGKPMLNFSFRDNGPGFSEAILREMAENEDEFFRHHKGFGNLKRRLNLIYTAESQIYVYNYPSGGAAIEVLIPDDQETPLQNASTCAESQEENHESADC